MSVSSCAMFSHVVLSVKTSLELIGPTQNIYGYGMLQFNKLRPGGHEGDIFCNLIKTQ